MKFSLNNFLYAVKQIVTGSGAADATGLQGNDGGFNADVPFDLNDVTLGTGTTASSTSNVPILSNAATNTSIGLFSFIVPRDYDQATDKLIVRVLARSAGTTDTPKLTLASSTTALGGTIGVAGTSVTGASLTNAVAAYEFNLSGQGLVRDTVLSGLITSAAHTTDAVQVFAIQIVYASCLVSYLDTNDALNQPLR